MIISYLHFGVQVGTGKRVSLLVSVVPRVFNSASAAMRLAQIYMLE